MSTTPMLLMKEQGDRPPQSAHEPMQPIEIRNLVPGSSEWLKARRLGIGGSDVAAILGLSPWVTAYEVFLDKRGQLPLAANDSGPLRWGRLLEPVLKQEYGHRTGFAVATVPMLRSHHHPFMLANLDGLVTQGPGWWAVPDSRVVEFKTARSDWDWGEDGSDGVPLYYLLQVQHYMLITGCTLADVAVLIGGSDFRILHVVADAELQAMLLQAELEFWTRVENNDPPPPANIADARRRWGALADRGLLIANDKDLELVHNLRETVTVLKEVEASEATQKKTLMERLGAAGADSLVDADGRTLITWKLPAAPRRFDEQAFAAEHPDLFKQYIRQGTAARRFLLKSQQQP
jgi:putative phage-type endonuclease